MSTYQAEPVDPETWVPSAPFMRVFECAALLSCTTKHILNLIDADELKVPQELKDSAKSGPAMRIPRPALIEFLRSRSSVLKYRRLAAEEARQAHKQNKPSSGSPSRQPAKKSRGGKA